MQNPRIQTKKILLLNHFQKIIINIIKLKTILVSNVNCYEIINHQQQHLIIKIFKQLLKILLQFNKSHNYNN